MDIIKYETSGTCSSFIQVYVEDEIIKKIEFVGGCMGNLSGISSLCVGMNINHVIERLDGIRCGSKMTSCPDQLAVCLREYVKQKSAQNVG